MNAHWRRRRRDVAGRPHRQSDGTSLGTVILALIAGALLTVTTGLAAMFELERPGRRSEASSSSSPTPRQPSGSR